MNYLYLALIVVFTSSCEGFLDQSPDSRVELNTPELLGKLLVDGYNTMSYSVLGELSSDNFEDNNAPDENGVFYHLSSFDRMDDEIFAWEPVVSSQDMDSPSGLWSGCYHAIAAANEVLVKVKEYESEGRGDEVSSIKGEAFLIRAYHHFILTNIFSQAYKNEITSKTDSGVPYITDPENQVMVKYKRSTVTDNYKMIEADLLAGLKLLDDTRYDVPKYHFNSKAAYAFAARFYLFKREYQKVVDYANLALGDNAMEMMRDWNADYPTYNSFADGWINTLSPNNFLLMPTYSTFNRRFGSRYGLNRDAADGSILGTGPTWLIYRYNPCYDGRLYVRGEVEYGVFFPKCGEYFEYSDKIAGIGYPHVVRAEFTAEETLLCRAEAYVFLNQPSMAIADLKIIDDSRKITGLNYGDLSDATIRNFYKATNPLFVKTFHTTEMSVDFVVSDYQKPLLDCVLHFRRLETMFDGMRWFDIKRYGIEITHKIGSDLIKTLSWNDPRRAIQIPSEVIAAGLSPNYRIEESNVSSVVKIELPLIKNN